MPGERVLADTSVCVDALRGGICLPELRRLALADRLVLPSPVLTELFAGARPGKDRAAVAQLMDSVPIADVEREDFISAGALGASLRRRGVTIGTVDLLLAALAVRRGEHLWSLDAHFATISERSELRLHHETQA
jgi:predicted nucleic acid-binding protein